MSTQRSSDVVEIHSARALSFGLSGLIAVALLFAEFFGFERAGGCGKAAPGLFQTDAQAETDNTIITITQVRPHLMNSMIPITLSLSQSPFASTRQIDSSSL